MGRGSPGKQWEGSEKREMTGAWQAGGIGTRECQSQESSTCVADLEGRVTHPKVAPFTLFATWAESRRYLQELHAKTRIRRNPGQGRGEVCSVFCLSVVKSTACYSLFSVFPSQMGDTMAPSDLWQTSPGDLWQATEQPTDRPTVNLGRVWCMADLGIRLAGTK